MKPTETQEKINLPAKEGIIDDFFIKGLNDTQLILITIFFNLSGLN